MEQVPAGPHLPFTEGSGILLDIVLCAISCDPCSKPAPGLRVEDFSQLPGKRGGRTHRGVTRSALSHDRWGSGSNEGTVVGEGQERGQASSGGTSDLPLKSSQCWKVC